MLPLKATQPHPADADTPQFQEVFAAHFNYVWTLLRRLGVASRDLEDVTHEVFVQVLQHLSDYDPARPVRPWLFGIGFNAASNYRRLARHRLELIDCTPERACDRPGAEDQLIQAQDLRLVEAALQEIELDRRAIPILHEIEGHAMPDIAELLNVPLNTAARRDFELRLTRLRQRRGQP